MKLVLTAVESSSSVAQTDPRLRKMWSWQIRTLHRREVRAWNTSQLQTFLGTTSKWKDLRKFLPRPSGQRIVAQPHEVFFVLSFVSSCQLLPDPCLGQMQKNTTSM